MGRNEGWELESRLDVLLAHLLKWKYQQGRRCPNWTLTIIGQRQKVSRSVFPNTYPWGFEQIIDTDFYPE